jgi:large conductance mechanosensitive channel
VGVIIGGAFGKIVDSMVKDIIMPVIGKVTGGLDFSQKYIVLTPPTKPVTGAETYASLQAAGANLLGWGNFLTIVLNFVILAFIIFQMVKIMNRFRQQAETAPAATPEDITLLREIRDSLKK